MLLYSLFSGIFSFIKFALLYIQKIYGSKKVIPQFLLPPIYNYHYKYE